MATNPLAINSPSNPKSSVDASLWWDSFSHLLTELEQLSLSSDLPSSLVKKLKSNHVWFLDTVVLFKPPNKKSREALNFERVSVGEHQLVVEPQLKDAALRISDSVFLDEVQSYILIKRAIDQNNVHVQLINQEFLHTVLLQYYIERQCLLKCTRQIIMHALYVGIDSKESNAIKGEALKLISEGLESKLLSVLQNLLSSTYPEDMDVDLFTLWAEEILIEDSLVLDILFLAYYESLCTCTGEQWKIFCSLYKEMVSGFLNFGRLAISDEATDSIYLVKVQLLLILMETLNLENLLMMIHDETPFRQAFGAFSLTDVQEMDAIISSLNAFEKKEAGPLVLTWAVFLCLVISLPGKEDNNVLTEIDHISYLRQAFEAASLSYFLEILQSDILSISDGPVTGYRSVLRTFISAFVASYEISLQPEDITHKSILDILCKIYRGEESLCNQFWDKDSITDGPIRCLLGNLEGEFPIRIVELVRFLSAQCEGTWPAECVYNFLDKSVGISTLFEISEDSLVDHTSQMVETHLPLHVPGIEGLLIPSNTSGHILRMMDKNTALVRWEYAQSGLFVLLLRLAQELYVESNEEIIGILDLLCRLVSSNTAVCCALLDMGNLMHVRATDVNGRSEKNVWCKINIVEILCTLIRNLSPICSNAVVMSMSISIFAQLLKCSPSHVSAAALKAKVFDVASKMNVVELGYGDLSSESWLVSGILAKMLLIDSERNDTSILLTLSVLDFTMQLVKTGLENDAVQALVIFSLQFICSNHEYWKYKAKEVRWRVTLKALEMMEVCIISIPYSQKLGEVIQDILLCDSFIHSTLFRVISITPQALEKLYVSRLFEPVEIEGLELAICSVLQVLFTMLSNLSKDASSSLPFFHQAVLSSETKPLPVVEAVISLMSYSRNMLIQVKATQLLSLLFSEAVYWQSYLVVNVGFGLNDKKIADLRNSCIKILCENSLWNEDLYIAVVAMLTSAALYQPAFLVTVNAIKENNGVQSVEASSLVHAVLGHVERSNDLIQSKPRILLNVLNFLKALWQGAGQYTDIIEQLKSSGNFWKQLTNYILLVASKEAPSPEDYVDKEALNWAYSLRCQSVIFELIAYDMFLQEKLLHAELFVKKTADLSKNRIENVVNIEKSKALTDHNLMDILSSWSESSFFRNLIESFSSFAYDNEVISAAKVAATLVIVHVMSKIATGDVGSLSVSLSEKIRSLANELSGLPAFSELLAQYSHHGYSEGKELKTLILSDLYYHLQGELEGRKIDHGPFKELSQFLRESKVLHRYQHRHDGDLFAPVKDIYVFDTVRLRADLGLDIWDHSDWSGNKAIAETMLLYMQKANSMVLLATAKLSALRALITLLTMCNKDSTTKKTTLGGISDQLIPSCIDHTCECFRSALESIAPMLDASEYTLGFLAAQADLLHYLCKSVRKNLPLPSCILVLKTSGAGLKVLSDLKPSGDGVKSTIKSLLLLLISSIESICRYTGLGEAKNMESSKEIPEVSNVCLGLLPILCNHIEMDEYCSLSLTVTDYILRIFLSAATWFPVMQKHLHFHHLICKLQDKESHASIPIILKFLLTLARIRAGAEMLLATGFFSSLRVLFADLSDGMPFSNNFEKPQHVWGLGLAVVIAIISSIGASSSRVNIIDDVISYFFSEKAHVISYYLNAPDYPSDNHDKKRARSQKTVTSLAALKETENTLLLMCEMVKHWNSWVKAMKGIDSQLREKSIHLLAFISRGTQRIGESSSRNAPLLCPPIHNEEVNSNNKPSYVKSKNGWFFLSPLGCKPPSLLLKDQTNEQNSSGSPTYFSDSIALQIYRIAFLLLKFLCLQAEGAAKRAEEVGFVDVAHFPELPMPEILHGLQDQAITIVTEICLSSKSNRIDPKVEDVCSLLMQIMEMALHLELCVSQICGIRPVLGRVEDFTKEARQLIKAVEGHVVFNASMKSLKQIFSLLYPGLLHSDGFF